jgi:putative flippase GtrA
MQQFFNYIWQKEKKLYLMVGVWNTCFGYGLGVAMYSWLSNTTSTALIGLLVNGMTISMSFATYKIFVFKTQGNWVIEYARSYISYGGMAVIGTFILIFLIDFIGIEIWAAQALSMLTTVILSYYTHKKFTFKR